MQEHPASYEPTMDTSVAFANRGSCPETQRALVSKPLGQQGDSPAQKALTVS